MRDGFEVIMRAFITILLILAATSSRAEKILLIESYSSNYEWNTSYVLGLQDALGNKHQFSRFQMQTDILQKSHYQYAADQAYQTYLQFKPDVVILGDDNALYYLLPKLYDEPIVIVFLGINTNPRELLLKYKGRSKITGVLDRPYFVKTLADIGRLLPKDRRKVLILFDSGTTASVAQEYMQTQYRLIEDNLKIEVEFDSVSTERAWKNRILMAHRQGFGAVVLGLYHNLVDPSGERANPDEILSWTNKNSAIPIFGVWGFSIGKGKALGGVVVFGSDQGKAAGNMVLDIIDRKIAIKNIAIRVEHQATGVYSLYEMQRWGLKPPSGWTALVE
jgi:hypothetical protein